MPTFKILGDKISRVPEKRFSLEGWLQSIVEKNTETMFGLEFIAHELTIHNFRIDTLAWNPDTRSFVIIEYKKDRNYSVVDQGFSYLSVLLSNKADFVLEYNERRPRH